VTDEAVEITRNILIGARAQLSRNKRYPDGRQEADVMWAGLRLVETQFAEAGFAPR
jgi:hypothetical protein